ncbi:type II toxin-antitoxin system VapB family antitoxin [Lacisediminihabitans changchengi]|uniref:Type II toxin-antitoxin system VapB family antitoxin n=1 Tax=Lacisediminihabitans changchengi TaxID=2787634 RepID=A0A934W442_9MICO|nr:type II toxin-antitoxin system VapB family antitoxin [Lacisediminihabitans changchengi]MBK4347115.1 type II toxin-antitoxin system VapB family antitoxin [Lacisediminihabitans changchengi]
MAVTSIDIDKSKIEKAQELTGARSQREVVDMALDLLINTRSFDPGKLAARLDAVLGNTLQELADR